MNKSLDYKGVTPLPDRRSIASQSPLASLVRTAVGAGIMMALTACGSEPSRDHDHLTSVASAESKEREIHDLKLHIPYSPTIKVFNFADGTIDCAKDLGHCETIKKLRFRINKEAVEGGGFKYTVEFIKEDGSLNPLPIILPEIGGKITEVKGIYFPEFDPAKEGNATLVLLFEHADDPTHVDKH